MSQAGETAPADALLAHTEWLHQLARALVGEAAAPDVVQDTFEIALAKPPRRDGPLRPWLGGVARNVARMATRGRVRRERREDAAATPVTGPSAGAEVPSPDELVARAELQQRVARLVLELPEPLRATVLLRFFEGMTASEIARAQGIPAGTVRSRLKDALDRIRATLDQEHAGDRRAWILLLAPIAPLPAVAPSGAAVAAGGLLVKTGVKVLIALVVAALLVVGARFAGLWGDASSSSSSTATKPTEPRRPTSPVPPPPGAKAAAGSPRALPRAYDDDPKGTLRLEGQVVAEDKSGVAHATVAIDANPPIVVQTDEHGSFVVEGLIRRDYRIEATEGDRYGGPIRLRLADTTEPVTITIKRGGTVEVQVSDGSTGGKRVAGAEVELRSTLTWTAKTDADGVARIKGVGPTWAPLAVRATGYAPAALMVHTSGDADTVDKFAMTVSRGALVAGRVVDDAGKPVAGARVVPTSASEPLPVVDPRRDGVVSGPKGEFEIPVVAAGTWRLTASHGASAPVTSVPLTVDGAHPRTGVELVLSVGAVVRGVVKDGKGAAIAGADVAVVVQGHTFWRARRQAFTDADGKFEIAGLARRPVEVVAFHESGASAIVAADLSAKREHDLALTLDITGSIAGTVVDGTGAPLAEAQVIAEPDWSGGVTDRAQWIVRGVQETVADQAGAFRFHGLPEGTYRLRAAREGAPESALDLSRGVTAKPGTDGIKITVLAEGRAIGKVLLADGTAPAAFALSLGDADGRSFATKDGAFSLPATAGTYVLDVTGPGFVSASKEVTIAEGKDTDLGTITVQPGRSVSGRVVDHEGVPVAGATVAAGMLLTGGGSELYIKDESIGASDTTTDDRGRFVLKGFPPASITILAGKPGVGRAASLRLPASPDSAVLDLVLAPTTSLSGKIVRDGKPLPDTVVIANPIGAIASAFFVTTGPDGSFALDTLAPGPYVVYPMLGGGGMRPKDMFMRRVDVAAGKPTDVTIDATPGAISLAITVVTDKGVAVPMAQFVAVGAAIAPGTVDELRDGTNLSLGDGVVPVYMRGVFDGALKIDGLKPGAHTLCVIGGDPRDPATAKLHCAPTKLTNAASQKAAITVPAAWLDTPN